ncbi:MAG: lipopolysaccharide biosynthesis protein RfbH [Vallitalea sp.]|jgi:CDP-6-deoxy-D-xylo-4-hexulose-3-dehydrase|nr:lipopolysaccharide biosynthesis protein RfbH [Vallitalea sp.]
MSLDNNLKNDILHKVEEYYYEYHNKNEYSKGDKIPFAGRVYDKKELVNLVDASLDFWLTAGKYADEFESKFAKFMEVNYCILVNSGSSANLIAMTTLTSPKLGNRRLRKGDEVITIAAGFPTTVNPIIQNGLIPVFVDVELGTYNIKVDELEDALSEKTRAIIIAHTLGNPFNVNAVMKFAQENDLYVIEDCCDAVGSKYDNKMVGSFGHLSTVSFYPAHHMTMGEGGAVLTNNTKLMKIATSFRDWGRDCYCKPGKDNTCGNRFRGQYGRLPQGYDHKYVYSHIGYNLKLTDMQAAIGIAQLEKLPHFIKKRKDNYRKLKDILASYDKYLMLPRKTIDSEPSWFGFPISLKENIPFTRREIINHLEDNNIMTRLLFAGNITKQPAYENTDYRVVGNLSNTDYIMNNTFFIGVYPGIDDSRLEYISEVFEEFFNIY